MPNTYVIMFEKALCVLAATLAVSMAGACQAQAADAPRVTHVGLVSPNILGVTLKAQRRVPAERRPYVAEPGDEIAPGHHRWLTRDGKELGAITGREQSELYTFDRIEGAPLDPTWADKPDSYALRSGQGTTLQPVRVHRKSKPTDEARLGTWNYAYPQQHTVYLVFDTPLTVGETYTVDFRGHEPAIAPVTVELDPDTLRSEAVHVSHIGFRPDDAVKVGYLSLWMGDGGRLDYPAGTRFRLIDQDNKTVFTGEAERSLAKEETEAGRGRNYNLTDVHRLDFSAFSEPGTYRLVVDGVGCSYPFEIREGVWEDAFQISMMGLLHHRSGIELGPPVTSYVRPRTMVPGEDGFEVHASDTPMIRKPGETFSQKEVFDVLSEHATGTPVAGTFGGYMDAGDWDRRVQHLFATRLLLELYGWAPEYFDGVRLRVPEEESRNGLADILDEALFNLDLYRRMQEPEGGVRGWIESASHPRYGETSWQESLPVYVTKPDPYASHLFAATAARFAHVARDAAPELARDYLEAAVRAFDWAEREIDQGGWDEDSYLIRDQRNLAAVELLRATGDERFHSVFLETTAFNTPRNALHAWQQWHQREAAYVYAELAQQGTAVDLDTEIARNARGALLREADDRASLSQETGFGWTNDRNAWVGWGQQSALVNSLSIVRAHALTNDEKYLATIQRAVQFGAGANPMNISLTTGVGHDWPRNPLHGDSRKTNQPAPAGTTIYGPTDPIPRGPDQQLYWADRKMDEAGAIYPDIRAWPALESHWDIFMHPAAVEYTIHQTIGPTNYLWGYLAARGSTTD